LALVDDADEVIIPAPFWVTYSEIVKLAGGKVIAIPTTAATDYKINAEDLRKVINEKTKLFMFSSPCNPSGALYSEEELAALVNVFEEFPEVWIMSDEIYEHINYTGKHHTIASFSSIKDRTIVVNGLSKSFAMTGWRLGYMAAIAPLAKACEKLQGQFTSAPNSITQRAAITALDGGLGPTMEMVDAFKTRRGRILELMGEIEGIKFNTPASAFYVFPEVSALFGKKTPNGDEIKNSGDLCMYLLNDAHVSTVSGSAFGLPECIRISFANSLENIEAGMKKIKDAIAALV
jgi:aspartate aminotransferase